MKTISIFGKPNNKSEVLTGKSKDIKVVWDDTGEDITTEVKSISIDMKPGCVTTAKLEFSVNKVDLENIKFILHEDKKAVKLRMPEKDILLDKAVRGNIDDV